MSILTVHIRMSGSSSEGERNCQVLLDEAKDAPVAFWQVVHGLAKELVPGSAPVLLRYFDEEGDACTFCEETVRDTLSFARPTADGGAALILEASVRGEDPRTAAAAVEQQEIAQALRALVGELGREELFLLLDPLSHLADLQPLTSLEALARHRLSLAEALRAVPEAARREFYERASRCRDQGHFLVQLLGNRDDMGSSKTPQGLGASVVAAPCGEALVLVPRPGSAAAEAAQRQGAAPTDRPSEEPAAEPLAPPPAVQVARTFRRPRSLEAASDAAPLSLAETEVVAGRQGVEATPAGAAVDVAPHSLDKTAADATMEEGNLSMKEPAELMERPIKIVQTFRRVNTTFGSALAKWLGASESRELEKPRAMEMEQNEAIGAERHAGETAKASRQALAEGLVEQEPQQAEVTKCKAEGMLWEEVQEAKKRVSDAQEQAREWQATADKEMQRAEAVKRKSEKDALGMEDEVQEAKRRSAFAMDQLREIKVLEARLHDEANIKSSELLLSQQLCAKVAELQQEVCNSEAGLRLLTEAHTKLEAEAAAVRLQVIVLEEHKAALRRAGAQTCADLGAARERVATLEAQCDGLQTELAQVKQAAAKDIESVAEVRFSLEKREQEVARLAAESEARCVEAKQAKAEAVQAAQSAAAAEEKLARVRGATGVRSPPSAAVVSSAPLMLGVEAREEEAVRGVAGGEFHQELARARAREAYHIGRVHLPAGSDMPATPACACVTICNDGEAPWPATAVMALLEGESFGLPLLPLGPLRPGEVAEVEMDLLLPALPEAGTRRSFWTLADAATGGALGPLLVFEAVWVAQ